MNYRHAYHAGNFADVVKHVVLVALLDGLRAKPKPFFALDAHAGTGRYALGAEAAKTGEYRDGIARVIDAPDPPPVVARYLALVGSFNPDGGLTTYPGSPRLIRSLMRPGDRLATVELHPDDAASLGAEFRRDPQVAIHRRDAYEALKALLPPTPRRGLALLDPAFEAPDELDRLARGIATARRRWPEGAIVAWYPIKDRPPVDVFLREAATAAGPGALAIELTLFDRLFPGRLNGCGLLLANPPYGLADALRPTLPWLHTYLARDGGGWRLGPPR